MPDADALPPMMGLRHLALFVTDASYAATRRFYIEGMGMAIDWEPDADNVYLSSGPDNLAIHRGDPTHERSPLDHLGFAVARAADVDLWYARFDGVRGEQWGIELLTPVKRHRDGATSFYLMDPGGNRVQILHVPSMQGAQA